MPSRRRPAAGKVSPHRAHRLKSGKKEGDAVVGQVKDEKIQIPLKNVQRFLVEERISNTWKTVGLVAGIVAAGLHAKGRNETTAPVSPGR